MRSARWTFRLLGLLILGTFVGIVPRTHADTELPQNTLFYTSLSGIGAGVIEKDDFPVISKILPSSPAQKIGLQVGDCIVQIDGTPTKSLPLAQTVQRLRGPEGSKVTLLISRGGAPLTFSITRVLMRFRRANEATTPPH